MMNVYWNGTRSGGAMSAEEYNALLTGETAAAVCGCEGEERMPGGCRPDPEPEPVEGGCCCKKSFRAALSLLSSDELAELLDFDLTAFLTDDYAAGAAVTETVDEEGPADNLVAPLAGSFRRFAPCTCDLLDITAPLYAVPEILTGLTAAQVNLCELAAVVIQQAETEAEGELSAEEVAARNFRRVRRILSRRLDPGERETETCCACACSGDCCCDAGIKAALTGSNLSRRVSLAAGPLLLNGVTLLGTAGNVLVLANDEDYRIYFVCVNKVQFLA